MELIQWLLKNQISKKQMAKDLKLSPLTLYFTVAQKRTPTLAQALSIYKYTKGEVAIESLLSIEEKKKMEEFISEQTP